MTRHKLKRSQARERQRAWDVLRNSASGRMAAALGGRFWPFELAGAMSRLRRAPDNSESERRYFRRRSDEERRAARQAAGIEARNAHSKLARLYAGLSRGGLTLSAATQH